MPTVSSIRATRPSFSAFDSPGKCRSSTSSICSPTVFMGFRLVIGSWNIIEMRLPRRPSI